MHPCRLISWWLLGRTEGGEGEETVVPVLTASLRGQHLKLPFRMGVGKRAHELHGLPVSNGTRPRHGHEPIHYTCSSVVALKLAQLRSGLPISHSGSSRNHGHVPYVLLDASLSCPRHR